MQQETSQMDVPITQLDWMPSAASSVMAQLHNMPIPCDSPRPHCNRWNIETFCRPSAGIRPNGMAIVRIGYRTTAICISNTCSSCVPFLVALVVLPCVWCRDRWLLVNRSVWGIYCSPSKSLRWSLSVHTPVAFLEKLPRQHWHFEWLAYTDRLIHIRRSKSNEMGTDTHTPLTQKHLSDF